MHRGPRFLGWSGTALLLALVPAISLADGARQTPPAPQDDIATLRKMLKDQADLIRQLMDRIERLEKAKGTTPAPVRPTEEPDIPALEIPSDKTPAPASPSEQTNAPTAGASRASLTPDIAVIGNNYGRFLSVAGDPDRNRLQLNEIELALEQPVYTGIKFKTQIAGDAGERFSLAAEEAYVTFSQLGHLPLGGMLGRKRLSFGKINPIHPHARPYVDQPAAVQNFLGPDGLSGNGASVNYLFPLRNLYANLELGLFDTSPADAGVDLGTPEAPRFYSAGLGVTGNFPMARLWTSKAFGKGAELELGASHGFGKADIGDNISLTGLDLTYRNFPGTFKRLSLQAEAFWHRREDRFGGTGEHTRSGHYAMLTYSPDQYYDYGFRYDNSRFPWPIGGREQSYSFIWSNRLTEATVLRLQYKYGDRVGDVFLPGRKGFNEIYLQFIWGAGSHTHPLQ